MVKQNEGYLMKIFEHSLYQKDVWTVMSLGVPWNKLKGSSILISGASGLLGSFLVDVIMGKNQQESLNCRVIAMGRSKAKALERFGQYINDSKFRFVPCDVNFPIFLDGTENIDYVIHLASNTHPKAYALDPIGTITTNVLGVKNMLDFCEAHHVRRFAFASSNEIYGENRGDVEKFNEEYCGYINCNTLRAGYPESKRCGEALCQAYIVQKGLDIVIPRFTRSYGPTLQKTDTKALSQFLQKAVAGENIILKSQGTQYYSYTYMADAISGLLMVLLCGKSGEAYNIADSQSDIRLKDLAGIVAKSVGREVVFEVPDEVESMGYSKATKARLDSKKLQLLGWRSMYSIENGVWRTIKILRDCFFPL